MGAGANDLVVLDSNDNSANILVIDQTFGKVSVVNFFDDAARTTVGNHAIDFTSYLNGETSNTGSVLSEDPIAVTLNVTPITAAGSLAAANSVNMLRLAGTAAESFAALSAEDLITALNGDGTADDNYANITNATLDAAANTAALVGNEQDHIVMVENAANLGEYKVFYLTSTVDTDTNTTGGDFDTDGVLLGTLDFGNSINFNLVGEAGWSAIYNGLIDAADDIDPSDITPPTLVSTDPADNAVDVAVDADLVFTFSEDVQAGTGNISVWNAGGVVETVPVGNAVFDGNTVTVDLATDLDPGTAYYVRVGATAIQDLAGNAFAGITNPGTFNFTTAGEAPTENTFDMEADGTYAGTVGEVDVFRYEVDSSSGRAVGTDGEVEITGFTAGEDRIEFVDAGDQLTTANFETFPGVSLAENPFADNTTIAFDPEAGVSNIITIQGIQDDALDTIDYAVV
jgi:methionine-rich copper-binding protein CopC